MSASTRGLILALALVGLGFSTAAARVHYRLLTDPSYVSPCDINSTFSCSSDYESRFGSVHGVPTAVAGLVWFTLVVLVAAFARPGATPSGAALLFSLSVSGLAVVFVLAYASVFVLGHYCVLCMGAWASVLGIFALTSRTVGSLRRLPSRVLDDLDALAKRPAVLVVALLYLAGAFSLVTFFPREGAAAAAVASALDPGSSTNDAHQAFVKAWDAQPRVDLGVPADGAAVVVVKFNDYECEGCREAEIWYQPILQKFAKTNPGAIKYVMKDWPWNTACNFNTASTFVGHEASCVAAAAARMAERRNKFDAMKTWLFANQGTTPDAVKEAAARILGDVNFDEEYARELPEIKRDVADGGVLGIHTTPTFFINGVRLPDGAIQPEYFELALSLEIEKQSRQAHAPAEKTDS